MNEEEIKAIEYWKEKLKDYKKEIIERQNDEFKGYGTLEDIAKLNYCTLHTVLNLIEKQKYIIEGKECVIETQAHNEEVYEKIFEYKDKMIDLMLDEMAFNHNINSIVDVLTIKKQLKEKFMNKAKEKK